MITLKLAFRNVLKHKWSSAVMMIIVAVAVFAMFWIFGFSNTFSSTVEEKELFQNGHLSYQTAFLSSETLDELIIQKYPDTVSEAIGQRKIMCISASEKESGPVSVTDLNSRNAGEYAKYKLDSGRMPESDDEILISIEHSNSKLEVGDSIYITAFTFDKIVNTMKYKVVGRGRIGEHCVITESSMTTLINSPDYFNNIIVYVKGDVTSQRISSLDASIKTDLTGRGIKIDHSTNFIERMKESEVLSTVFNVLKIIVMIILFPLIGSVLGAIVWIHSYRRRGEIWTCSALGFNDRSVRANAVTEYIIIAVLGIIAGISAGFLTSMISEKMNGMIVFSYVMEMLLVAEIKFWDILVISVFILANMIFWIRIPVNKILKSKPFSY
ncbi:MAG: FtsX-like permease family protein [Spirochaetes bacterium]|nr:FtsX-like permease family protein [Spirochaetota bacterium]